MVHIDQLAASLGGDLQPVSFRGIPDTDLSADALRYVLRYTYQQLEREQKQHVSDLEHLFDYRR